MKSKVWNSDEDLCMKNEEMKDFLFSITFLEFGDTWTKGRGGVGGEQVSERSFTLGSKNTDGKFKSLRL
jgi:hypothetical protein